MNKGGSMKIGNATITPHWPGLLVLGSALFVTTAAYHDDRTLSSFDSTHGTNFSDFGVPGEGTNSELANKWADTMARFYPDGDNKLNPKEEVRARGQVEDLRAYERGTWIFSPRANSAFFERALNDRVEIEKE